jgi:phytoene desaturase
MSKKVTIIGAGPGGLASALLLAGAGLEVTVLERLDRVGGRTSRLELEGGPGTFRFDLGPTFFLYPQILRQIFAAVGADLDEEVELVRLDPQYRLVFGAGGELTATPDVAEMEQAVAALSPSDGRAFRRFLTDNQQKFECFRPCLEAPFESWRDVVNGRMLKLLPRLKPWRSLDAELGSYFSDPRIRLAFSFQSKYLGMSPFRCPSLFSILSYLEYEHGVFHPVGGCGAVTAAMARVARDLGVDIRLNESVRDMLFDGRRAVGVRTDQGIYRSDAMVVNADFARAMRRLVPDRLRRRWSNRNLDRKKFSCSTFMLYLGVDGTFPDLPHHSIYIAADYQKNLDEIERRQVLSDDPSFYVQNPGVTDSTLAPAGTSALYVLVPVPHQNPHLDWQREAPRLREIALSQLAKAGFAGVEGRILAERCITPNDWDRGFEIHRGATFNLAHSLDQMLHLRPKNRFDELDGVYLVGGGTHPGSGLPVIFQSALISSRLLLEDFGLAADWTRASAARTLPDLLAEAV